MEAKPGPTLSTTSDSSRGVASTPRNGGRLPDFLILGAQKSATTSLFAYLRAHPDVCGATIPEPHFFGWAWNQGVDWYRGLFPNAEQGRVAGEKSPLYLPHPRAPARAAGVVPGVQLLVILRDPVERAISNYHHTAERGREARSIEDAFAADEQLIGEAQNFDDYDDRESEVNRRAYLRKGVYVDQIDRWLQHFDRSQLLVLEDRQLSRDGSGGFLRALEFLGLTPFEPPNWERNAGSYDATTDRRLRARTAKVFEPYNRRLFDLLGTEWDWA